MLDLLLVVVEAGAGAFLRPALRALHGRADLNWRIVAAPMALRAIGDDMPPGRLLAGDLNRTDGRAALAFVEAHCPKALVVSAGGWEMEHGVIAYAREQGIPTAQYVDIWYGYRRRLLEGPNGILPDSIMVIDELARGEAIAEGLPRERLVLCGHPLWSSIPALPPTNSRDTIFLGAPVRRGHGRDLGYTEEDAWNCLCEAAVERPDLFGKIRYAPHPEQSELPQLPSEDDFINYSTDLLDHTGQVIGMFSAPLIEAFLAGRRSISLQPHAASVDMAPLSRFGLSPRATDRAALIAALEAPSPDPAPLRQSLDGSVGRFIACMEAMRAR